MPLLFCWECTCVHLCVRVCVCVHGHTNYVFFCIWLSLIIRLLTDTKMYWSNQSSFLVNWKNCLVSRSACLIGLLKRTQPMSAIWGPARFSSWSCIIHTIYKTIWYHCTAVWSGVSLVCWWHTAVCISGSWEYDRHFLFFGEFRTMYYWYSPKDDQ